MLLVLWLFLFGNWRPCYYVHICLVRRALGGLSVMSFVQYLVVIMYTCLVRRTLGGLSVMSFVQYFVFCNVYICLVSCTLEGLPVISFFAVFCCYYVHMPCEAYP